MDEGVDRFVVEFLYEVVGVVCCSRFCIEFGVVVEVVEGVW